MIDKLIIDSKKTLEKGLSQKIYFFDLTRSNEEKTEFEYVDCSQETSQRPSQTSNFAIIINLQSK